MPLLPFLNIFLHWKLHNLLGHYCTKNTPSLRYEMVPSCQIESRICSHFSVRIWRSNLTLILTLKLSNIFKTYWIEINYNCYKSSNKCHGKNSKIQHCNIADVDDWWIDVNFVPFPSRNQSSRTHFCKTRPSCYFNDKRSHIKENTPKQRFTVSSTYLVWAWNGIR